MIIKNENPKIVFKLDKSNEKPIFDFRKTTLMKALPDLKYVNLMKDVGNKDYLRYNRVLNELMNKILILYQSSGDMIILYDCVYTDDKRSAHYYGECYIFDENGNFIDYVGDVGNYYIDYLESEYFVVNV